MSHATNSTPGLLKAKQEMSVTTQPVKARDDELRVEDAAGGERFRQGWPAAVILVIGPSTQEFGRVHNVWLRRETGALCSLHGLISLTGFDGKRLRIATVQLGGLAAIASTDAAGWLHGLHPSGTPALRMPSMIRSFPARKIGLSLSWPRKRWTVKVESSVSPTRVSGRLVQLTEIREGGGEKEMRQRKSPVDLDRAAEPRDGLLVGAKSQLGATRKKHPEPGTTIVRREAEGLGYMSFGLSGATDKKLGVTDIRVSGGQIWIQRQRPLELGNGLGRVVGLVEDAAHAVAEGSWRGKARGDIRLSGYVVDTLEAALWSVSGSTTFEEAVLKAVNLGDDADTVGAVAGQVAGAVWGYSKIPEAWMRQLAWSEKLLSIADKLWDAT
jgi:ADP-ribosylglycohydrolase